MKIGDEIDTPEGKGKITSIEGDGKVAVVEVPYTAYKTIYQRIPDAPTVEPENGTVQ